MFIIWVGRWKDLQNLYFFDGTLYYGELVFHFLEFVFKYLKK